MSESEFFTQAEYSFRDSFTDIRKVYSSTTGHTEVYEARKALKRFALKALKPDLRGDPFYVGMLRKEFEIGFRLEHPFIIHTYSFEEVEGLGACIVLEWVDGETLATCMERHTLEERTWLKAASELCDALEYLERRQIVHRDIKPSNVMLTSDGHHVKLIDFGFADSPEYGALKHSGGTRGYAAPEQLSDSKITSMADIYALGKILETLPIKKNRKYRNLVSRMTSEHSGARPRSAGEVKAEWNKTQRGRRIVKLVLAGTLGICAVGAVALMVSRHQEETIRIQTDKENEELKPFDSPADENPAAASVEATVTAEMVESKKPTSTTPTVTAEPIRETTAPPVAGNAQRMVHWMVLLTARNTLTTASKLRESGDSLWELHTRQEVGGWVDSQTDSDPGLREECHEEIASIIEKVKRGE